MSVRILLSSSLVVLAGQAVLQNPYQAATTSDRSVRLDVTVTSAKVPVRGLVAADFVVTDNGVPQFLTSAQPAGHVAVALVLDHSQSLSRTAWTALVEGARAVAGSLQSDDVAGAFVASDRLSAISPIGASPAEIARTLGALEPPGLAKTMLWDAILSAAATIASDPGRRVVICFSDGGDNASWISQDVALKRLTGAGLTLDAVTVPSPGPTIDLAYGPSPWSAIHQMLGSLVVPATDAGLRDQIGRQLATLRSSYVVSFTPTGVKTGDGFHKIKVALKNRKADVETRAGYISPGPG